MRTHQGSRALNHTKSTHAPYSANATNQVGPSTWKNFCLRNCMAWLQAPSLPANQGIREGSLDESRGLEDERRVYRGRQGVSSPIPGCSLKIQPQRIIGRRIWAYEPFQQQNRHQRNHGGDSMRFKERGLQGLESGTRPYQRRDGRACGSTDDAQLGRQVAAILLQ